MTDEVMRPREARQGEASARPPEPPQKPLPPLAPPGGAGGLWAVFHRRYLLKLLVRRELGARYQGSLLGFLWSYVQPIVRFVMYFFVLGLVLGLHDNVENFGVHIFSAMVFVHFFTETFTAGTNSIVKNKALIRKLAMPREMFPVSSMLVSIYNTLPWLLILVGACLLEGWTPDLAGLLGALLGFAIMATLGTGLALLFSAANVFFRDFQRVVQTFTMLIHFVVPMIYPFHLVEKFGPTMVNLYLLNPLSEAVLLIQRGFWVTTTSNPVATAQSDLPEHLFVRGFWHLGACLLVLAIGQVVFSKLERKFPERL